MESDEEIEARIRQLRDPDWRGRAGAIRGNYVLGKRAVPLLPAIFDLCFCDFTPHRSDASLEIKRFGIFAVPFLLRETRSEVAERRMQALFLLAETGCRKPTHCLWSPLPRGYQDCILEPRDPTFPDWGDGRDEVLETFQQRLADETPSVRYAAAAASEEFGLSILETIPVFIDVLRRGAEARHWLWAAMRLGRIGPPAHRAAPFLAQLATFPPHDPRIEAYYGLEDARSAARSALKLVSATP